MSPDELRAASKSALSEIHGQDPKRQYSVAEVKRIVYSLVDTNELLADVLDLADDVTSYRAGRVGTHYEDCYRHHAGCLAARIQATVRGESTSHEERRER